MKLKPLELDMSNSDCSPERNALADLSTGAHYGAVVVLNEPKKLLLLWVWVEGDKSILQRDNLEVLSAEIQDVLLASLQLTGAFLELLWRQNLALSSLLD